MQKQTCPQGGENVVTQAEATILLPLKEADFHSPSATSLPVYCQCTYFISKSGWNWPEKRNLETSLVWISYAVWTTKSW